MIRLAVITDRAERARDLAVRLRRHFETECFQLGKLPEVRPGEFTLVDICLQNSEQLSHLRRWLKRRSRNSRVIFAIDRDSHSESIQAFAAGATCLFPRPIDGGLLSWMLRRVEDSSSTDPGESVVEFHDGLSVGINVLENIFAAAGSGGIPDLRLLNSASVEIVARIEEEGLNCWLESVRKHHSQTYQHCLIVTAAAVAFGQHLGFNALDRRRLASAGLLHDIGKARIPIEILEKPGPLDDAEMIIMRTHPELGREILDDAPDLQPEMLDMIVHHHEYLDGSGYPHGLQGHEITDLVRIMTIADIYGALIERRSYKSPLSGAAAYEILQDMGPKLDTVLVKEFRSLAQKVI